MVSIEDVLKEVESGVDGVRGAMLGGFDGVAVAAMVLDADVNIGEVIASSAMDFVYIKKVTKDIKIGEPEELMVQTKDGILYLMPVNKDCWIGLLLELNAIVGRAKLELKKAIPKMLKLVS